MSDVDNARLTKIDHGPGVTLPIHFNYLSNSNQTLSVGLPTPILWSTPRSGGNTLAQILGECQGFVMAGAWHGTPRDNLAVIFENGVKQVTADLTTMEGRLRARDQGLRDVHSDVVLLSSNLFETSQVFSGSFQAELWAWFRHPIERQISTYFFLQSLPQDHPSFNPRMNAMSLADWARSDLHTPNTLMTSLLGIPTNLLGWTEIDLTVAKNLLRRKAKVGLLERKTESIQRFLFGRRTGASGSRECQERLLDYAWTTKGRHPSIGERSDAYQLLVQKNSFDMLLYEYVRQLFEEQGT